MNTKPIIRLFSAALLSLTMLALGCKTSSTSQPLVKQQPGSGSKMTGKEQYSVETYDARRNATQLRLAEARWRENDVDRCRRLLEEILVRDPTHREANLRLAELRLFNDQPHKSLSIILAFCRRHHDDAEAHHLLGLAFEAAGEQDQSIRAFQWCVKLDPDDINYRTSLETAIALQNDKPPARAAFDAIGQSRQGPALRSASHVVESLLGNEEIQPSAYQLELKGLNVAFDENKSEQVAAQSSKPDRSSLKLLPSLPIKNFHLKEPGKKKDFARDPITKKVDRIDRPADILSANPRFRR